MNKIFSNGPDRDFVIKPFTHLIGESSRLRLAAPYFTKPDQILEAARNGKIVQLLVGLNEATCPKALRKLYEVTGIAVRYLTSRFHAKIYIFDHAALLGSSNLTDGGLQANREAVIRIDRDDDADTVDDILAIFEDLWESGQVLTRKTLDAFEKIHSDLKRRAPDHQKEIETALGQAQPRNIKVESHMRSSKLNFLEGLRREVYEQYGPAFREVAEILDKHGFRRSELASVGVENETNRFLNYVRVTHAKGDQAWQTAPLRGLESRHGEIMRYAREWVDAADNKVPEDYADWLETVKRTFGAREAIEAASKEEVTNGLMSLHAFYERQRFIKGGLRNLPAEFWRTNDDNVSRVKSTLAHLLHGPGDFIQRFHDILYDRSFKLNHFAYFCALELYGTVKPHEFPPMNGRMAKALRFLGFDVRGT